MVDVRESMAHLFGLGLYQDVQVDASLRGDGVVLTYNLFPAQRVRRIVFEGSLGLPESDLRRIVVERHGASPSLARSCPGGRDAPDALSRSRVSEGRDRCPRWRRADSSNVSMVFTIRPGARARIGAIEVQGAPREPAAQVLSALGPARRRRIRRRRSRRAAHSLCERSESAGLLRSARRSVSSIRRRRYGRESRAEHRAGTARGDRVPGRSARSRRSRSARPDRARALGRRRSARGLEVRHRASLSRARLLQSARRLPAQRRRGAEARGECRRDARDVHRHPRPAVHGRARRGHRQHVDHVGRTGAARGDQGRPAVQRFHRRLRCAANSGLLSPARIFGREGDVSGRAARAESRQRVRARQARHCRRGALGDRLGEFSGQYGHRCRSAAARDYHRAGAAILRAADIERCRHHRTAVSEPRIPRSDGGASTEGPRRRIEGGARLRHPRRARRF